MAIVPEKPTSPAVGVARYQAEIAPRHTRRLFVALEDDVQAAHVVSEIPDVGSSLLFQSFLPERGGDSHLLRKEETATQPSLDSIHHVGPIQRFGAFVVTHEKRLWEVNWDNRGRAEYETQYDPPAPDVPIVATLSVRKFAVSLSHVHSRIVAHNRMAEIEGRVEFLEGQVTNREWPDAAAPGFWTTTVDLPSGIALWRFAVEANPKRKERASVYLLDCREPTSCHPALQRPLTAKETIVQFARPEAGTWKLCLVVHTRRSLRQPSYRIHDVLLKPLPRAVGSPGSFERHGSGSRWSVLIPTGSNTLALRHALYVGFRLAPLSGDKDGQLISVSPVFREASAQRKISLDENRSWSSSSQRDEDRVYAGHVAR